MYPTLQEEHIEQINVVSGFSRKSQRKYDPCVNIYNPGWMNNPKFSYRNPQADQLV